MLGYVLLCITSHIWVFKLWSKVCYLDVFISQVLMLTVLLSVNEKRLPLVHAYFWLLAMLACLIRLLLQLSRSIFKADHFYTWPFNTVGTLLLMMNYSWSASYEMSSLSFPSVSVSGTSSLRQAQERPLCSARPLRATPWLRGRCIRPPHGPCPATRSPAAPSNSRSRPSTARGGARLSAPSPCPSCCPSSSATASVSPSAPTRLSPEIYRRFIVTYEGREWVIWQWING